MDSKKEKLFKLLVSTLNELSAYDIASLMPLLYVLVARKEGHLLSILSMDADGNIFKSSKRRIQSVEAIDGQESDLLKEIYNSVDRSYFEGRAAEIVYRFYDYCNEDILEYYQEIIEFIFSYYAARGGRFNGISITPTEVARLMANLIIETNPKCIYDPCAGLCTFMIQPEMEGYPFLGQEIDNITKVIADVRLNAFNRASIVLNEDSTQLWRGNCNADCLASELPWGVRIQPDRIDPQRPRMLEDAMIYNFVTTPALRKAVLLVSLSTCYRRENQFLRKAMFESNWVDCVVKLPAGILPNTGINTAILVLNKEKLSKQVKFISADDLIINEGRKRILDYQAVLDRLHNTGNHSLVPNEPSELEVDKEDKQTAIIDFASISEHDYSLDPSVYIQENIELLPGQSLVKFSDLTERVRTYQRFEEKRGRVLQPEQMFGSIIEMHTKENEIHDDEIPATCVKICDKCLIFNVRADKFYIKNDNEALFVTRSYSCFSVNESRCSMEYLADCVINAKTHIEAVLRGLGMQRVDWNSLILPFFEDLESQKQIVLRRYREEQNELKKKLESLQVLSGKSSDLIHNLGITFTKISAGIGKLRTKKKNEVVEGLNDNVQFALRQINSTGTDFENVHPEKEKVKIFDVLEQYVTAWGNFGYKTFSILPIKMMMSKDTKVEIDTNLFFTMLDCIFINAHQHGFNKRENADNKLLIEVEGVIYKDEQYVRLGISNNGKPLPANFTLQDFVQRGVVGINSSQDGIGGDHIHKIAHLHGGYVSIDSDSEWLTFNMLLPVYLTSNNTNFNDYECECI